MRRLLPVLLLVLCAGIASAQTPPSESRIKADVREHIAPNATVITIRGDGHRELNGGVYEYVRSITARYPHAEVEGVEIEGYHDIVYQSHGSSYAYKDYRVGDWQYFGLPDPSGAEILALLDTKPADAYPIDAVDLSRSVEVVDGGTVKWHNLESATVPIQMRYSTYDGNEREFVDFEWDTEVRIYREAYEAQWTGFVMGGYIGSATEVGRRPGEPGTRKISEAAETSEFEAYLATLPDINVPEFSSEVELAKYVYSTFRETTDRPTLEATLWALLAPSAYVDRAWNDGDRRRPPFATQMWMEEELDTLLEEGTTFREQTCPTMVFNPESYAQNGGRMMVESAFITHPTIEGLAMVFKGVREESGYRNGQPVLGGWKIGEISFHMITDPDGLAWLRSFDDPSSLCSAPGRAVQEARQETRGAVEGAVQEGRRRIGRIFGRRD